jgi:peptide deformylase
VQHECDHVFGLLYPMHIKDFSYFGFTDAFPSAQATQAQATPDE